MTKAESAALVAMLVAAFPGARFGEENAAAYEAGIADISAAEGKAAVDDLVRTSRYLPTVAEIRAEVVRQRKLRNDHTRGKLQLTDEDGKRLGPSPQAWGELLARMLHAADKHRALAERWYQLHAQKPPLDPAQPYLDLVQAGARGDDVRERFDRTVMSDESEKRYP